MSNPPEQLKLGPAETAVQDAEERALWDQVYASQLPGAIGQMMAVSGDAEKALQMVGGLAGAAAKLADRAVEYRRMRTNLVERAGSSLIV